MWHFWIFVILLGILIEGGFCLTNVNLSISPNPVQRGQHVVLTCYYDLELAPLYSVKWYRGRHEFYRYIPSEQPSSKIFPFFGFHVDLSQSNASQVVLTNVGFGLTGNFSCEVTTDAPSFKTKVVSQHMQVVVLPESKPIIRTEKERYEAGDILRANCTSPPSKPATTLNFLINNMATMEMGISTQHPHEDLFWTELSLEIRLDSHYFAGEGGRPVLKCIAQINSMYQAETQISLGPRVGDPIPERVRSPNATAPINPATSVHLMIFAIVCYVLR